MEPTRAKVRRTDALWVYLDRPVPHGAIPAVAIPAVAIPAVAIPAVAIPAVAILDNQANIEYFDLIGARLLSFCSRISVHMIPDALAFAAIWCSEISRERLWLATR